MNPLVIFKVIEVVIIAAFTAAVSDLRKKQGMVPLMNRWSIALMKVCYLIPIVVYVYMLVTLDRLLTRDYIALGLTLIAAILAIKARRDLGGRHAWTGYHYTTTELVATGVYSLIRHPMYTASCVFIVGGVLTTVSRTTPVFTGIVLAALAYVVGYLVISASCESKVLSYQFGDAFLEYKRQVHPFFPLRRFRHRTDTSAECGGSAESPGHAP
jgi:protein-S-isoprenylcysteine O-methyltransferase Ste14